MCCASSTVLRSLLLVVALNSTLSSLGTAASPLPLPCWNVDDLRPGMKGEGKTVMVGTKIEPFQVEILGVLKNTSPGRDMVLARLSGLQLDKTGVIAGMSGSPVYIEGKLLGAVAYAWPYGKEPIAGITPYSQMRDAAEASERSSYARAAEGRRLSLAAPLRVGDTAFSAVHVAGSPPSTTAFGELWMVPLQVPVAATGFTPHSLRALRECFPDSGLMPVQAGATSAKIAAEAARVNIEPGGSLAIALIQGDFDLSGIGTVTAVEGDKVYGWGHPFMSLGGCELPLMTGYVHTVYPRQTVSFKMGSPLRMVGTINADVSTCVAGRLGRTPDLVPVRMKVIRDPGRERIFTVQVVRQRSLFPTLVFTALTNAVDMEGDLPEELTADLHVRIEIEGHEPLVIRDTFSGGSFSGGRAPMALYSQVASLLGQLTYNPFSGLRITKIDCTTEIRTGRTTAEIESAVLDADCYAPGETMTATVTIRPFRGLPVKQRVEFKLPTDLPEGSYQLTISDDLTAQRAEYRERPDLLSPRCVEQVLRSFDFQTQAKRHLLTLRLPLKSAGVAIDGKPLPNLSSGTAQLLGQTRRPGTQQITTALLTRTPTPWVLSGSETLTFTIAPRMRLTESR